MKLFEPLKIGKVVVPNRIAKSAMVEGLADPEGRPTPEMAKLYRRWSAGGVGLMVTGMAHVLRGWSLTPTELGLYEDSVIEPLRRVTAAAHEHGGKLFVQLCHAPPQILRTKAQRQGSLAPCRGFSKATLTWTRAATTADLRTIAQGFGAAARRARLAEADGVQIHAAHGYLLSRFLSPKHNRRTDAWGGSFEKRLAFLRAVYDNVRAEIGSDFPVTVKLNAHDGEAGGLDLAESVRIGRALEEWGIDAIEVSAGTADVALSFYPNRGGLPLDLGGEFLVRQEPRLRAAIPLLKPYLRRVARKVRLREEAYFWPEATAFARALRVPILCVGGIRMRSTAERILTESPVAMVSLARPLVHTPDLPNRWRGGHDGAAGCTSCNRCFVNVGLFEPLRCDARDPS